MLTDLLMEIISWTLGEYVYLVEQQSAAIDVICDLLERPVEDEAVRGWMIHALTKLSSQVGVRFEKGMFARKVKLFVQLIFLRLICMDHAIQVTIKKTFKAENFP